MKKKPARQPRKIEVVEDAQVATKATKRKAKPAPTDATPAQPEPQTPTPEPNATVAKSGAKKGKTKATAEPAAPTQSERKPEQPSTIAWWKVSSKVNFLQSTLRPRCSKRPDRSTAKS